MNNVEEYAQLNKYDNYINGMGELNKEALRYVEKEVSCKPSADDLLADSIKSIRNTNEALDWNDSYESHYYPYDD